ncbi:hypothetical protein B9Z19DRAFT_1087182 [Tuber borchii]|uniref:C2H2-type domain-containing protein n=1 Tax=Tuber borchii TaxID=42251 RepID=A0A2T6ZNK8_TUBBO|nr:hypothetical protein B9Z19DRAFT_1087182 [Tuber borchii]
MHGKGTRMGCPTCRVTFYSRNAFRRHRNDPVSQCSPQAVTEFRCCDCDREFRNSRSLYIHLAAEHPNFREPPPVRTRGIHHCDDCDKSFEAERDLQLHLVGARVHNPLLEEKVSCVGGCKRKFNAPSSLLAHLESGSCKSGITWDKLDDAIIAQDRTNIITDPVAVLARKIRNLSLTNSEVSSICDGSTFDTPDNSSDAESICAQSKASDNYLKSHTAGGVSLTPDASLNEASSSSSGGSGTCTPSGDSTGTATPTAGVSGSGGIPISSPPFSITSFSSTDDLWTPSTSSIASNQPPAEPTIDQLRSWLLPDGTFECPICPPNTATFTRPSFATLAGLQTHMQSPTAHPQLNHNLHTDPHDPSISTASSESGIATPSTIPAHPYLLPNGKYECPLCPSGSRKLFWSLAVLQRHMLSPIAHMPKIYHCPDPESLGIAPSASAQGRKQEKSFATLSALAQHVESGACQGGRSMFKAVVKFINKKLADMGLGDRKMVITE